MQGQLVVIPAGCAHQVKNGSGGWNIKVAQDFVAPQSAGVCLQLLSEVTSCFPTAGALKQGTQKQPSPE